MYEKNRVGYQLVQVLYCSLVLFCFLAYQSDSTRAALMEKVHIIGGGPVGYCMGLTLAKRNIPCVIYEKSSSNDIKYTASESYPIGVNQRGLLAIRNAGSGSTLEKAIINDGYNVKEWKVLWTQTSPPSRC